MAYSIKKIEEIRIGDNYTIVINITKELVKQFAKLTGDYNPLHTDDEFAKGTPFSGVVAHGMLTGTFVSTLIGMHLPGPGSLWLSQKYDFLVPVRIGDTLSLQGEVIRKSDSQGIVFIKVEAKNQNGVITLQGEGKVKITMEVKKMQSKEIKNCNILITGASRGLGAAIALRFAKDGANVFLNYNSSHDSALEVQKQAESLDGTIKLAQGNITTEEGVNRVLKTIDKAVIDTVVFNAFANLKQAAFLEQDLEDFEHSLDYGMRSPVRVLKALLPMMNEQKYGRIVSILSTYACSVPPAGFSSYVVNKKALEAITKSIAVEYGKYNICANMISPNMLRTDLTAAVPERMKQLLEAQTPLKRLAELEEIAENVVHLCAPASSYVNGHNLVLSGGSTIV